MSTRVKCPSTPCGQLMEDPTEYVTVADLDALREDGLLQWPLAGNRISGYKFRCAHCATTLDVPLDAANALINGEALERCVEEGPSMSRIEAAWHELDRVLEDGTDEGDKK